MYYLRYTDRNENFVLVVRHEDLRDLQAIASRQKLNRNCNSTRRFPELLPPGPKPPASEFDWPNKGDARVPMGVPRFSWFKILRADTLRIRL